MLDSSKYRVGYFPVDKKYNKWVEKDHIEKPPVRCSVDMRDGNFRFEYSPESFTGTEPDIAGKDLANPIGTILSAAMMLRFSFNMSAEADAIENAVSKYLDAGYRTADIMGEGMTLVGCKKCGDLIVEFLFKE